jgi:anti-anti-sigma regulatory factor
MFLATSNPARRLLLLNYRGQVRPEELRDGRADLKTLLAGLPAGFHLLVDLSGLEAMHPDCAAELGRIMDLLDQSGVGLVVRVIPKPDKDIGFNILTIFHYQHRPQIITCESMAEAALRLSL